MMFLKKYLWVFLILFVVAVFFFPIFKGQIPFPGDLLINANPYSSNGYLGFQAGGYPNKAQGPDVIYEIYPWRFFSINQLKEFSIPFWNPHNFSGNPQMANFQTATFYPLNFIYFLLPFNISWTILIILQPLLGAIFMYLFLKKGIGTGKFPSLIGAVSFGFSSYMTVWIEYGNIGNTFLWLPLVLLLTKYFFDKKKIIFAFATALTLSASILAGYIQGVFYIYVLSFSYYVFLALTKKEPVKNYKKHILFLVSLLLPILITAFQILPTLQIFSQSTREAYTLSQIEKNLAPLISWITIFFPDFFGNPATRNYWINGTYIERVMYPGAVVLFFAFFGVFNKSNFLEKKFFAIAAILSLLIATNIPFIKYFYLLPIPLISTTVPTRELSIFIFCILVLGSMGLDVWLSQKVLRLKTIFIYPIIFITAWIIVIVFQKMIPSLSSNLLISERNLILPTIFAGLIMFAFLLKKKNIKLAVFLIFVVCIFDLFYFFHKITPFSPSELVYPQTELISFFQKNAGVNRFWGYGSAYIPSNFQSVDKTFSPEGNDPLHISTYGELLSASQNGRLPKALPRPDANIAAGYGPDDLRSNFYRKRVIDLLGVKYIVHKKDLKEDWNNEDLSTFPEDDYKLVYKTYPWQVYENLNALPRFFLSSDYIYAKNKKEALSLVFDKNLDLRKTVILEQIPSIKVDKNATGSAELITYKPNNVIFKTSSTGNSLLFLSDNYYLEWGVKIDGTRSKILVANYSFRAVEVPMGLHTVEFFYEPKSFNLGILIGFLGIVSLVVGLLYIRKYENKL